MSDGEIVKIEMNTLNCMVHRMEGFIAAKSLEPCAEFYFLRGLLDELIYMRDGQYPVRLTDCK